MTMTNDGTLPASFRDPAGFLFSRAGILYRQVNQLAAPDYDLLMTSGLYENLITAGLLIPHEESTISPQLPSMAYKILKPQRVPFISYPYEWSFSQLQDAALATLRIQRRALKKGLSLKDASAYNIQFFNGQPVLIDTLSFEAWQAQPWTAYRQFCQHFLAPLALMAYTDVRLNQLLRVYVDGIPLDLAARLLPWQARLVPGLLAHLFLHAAAQQRAAQSEGNAPSPSAQVSLAQQLGILESLTNAVKQLRWQPKGTAWGQYYDFTNYNDESFAAKRDAVRGFLEQIAPRTVWDLGANTGVFSRLAVELGAHTVAWDIDPAAVEQNYRQCRAEKTVNLLPLLLDLTNPSPALGWAHQERNSFLERAPVDVTLALALIHHLAIGNNLPLPYLARFFAQTANNVLIEFVPKEDSQVQKMLRSRKDIFDAYTREHFERAFAQHFEIVQLVALTGSLRTLYWLRSKV